MGDITLHVYFTLLRPIMAALHVFIVLSHVEDSKQSYLSSLPPPEDIYNHTLLRYVEDPSSDKPRIEPLVSIDFTSKNVFVSRSDDGDSATLTDNHDANELLAYLFRTSSTKFSKGSAVNFHWPSTVSDANKEEVTKALIPLWRKLARSKLGVLSSFDKTVFLVREKRTLFISSAYRAGPLSSGEVSPMLATYCFFKWASGYYGNEGLCLPNIYPEDKSET